MSGGWQPQPGYPQPQGWSQGKKLALAITGGLLLGGVVLGVMVLADSGDDDSDLAAASDETTTTTTTTTSTTATTSTTVAPTTTTSTTVPAVSVVPPEGYTQDQADAYLSDIAAALPDLPADLHQSVLELSALECDLIDVDPELGPLTMEATRSSREGEFADAMELGGVDAATAADLEERVNVAAADAAADQLCPEHAEHIRID